MISKLVVNCGYEVKLIYAIHESNQRSTVNREIIESREHEREEEEATGRYPAPIRYGDGMSIKDKGRGTKWVSWLKRISNVRSMQYKIPRLIVSSRPVGILWWFETEASIWGYKNRVGVMNGVRWRSSNVDTMPTVRATSRHGACGWDDASTAHSPSDAWRLYETWRQTCI